MSALNLSQIETRLRTMRWNIPGFPQPRNLWGSEEKGLISYTTMVKLINQAIDEWAKENLIDKSDWILDDGAGGEGTLTADQRRYTLPNDFLFVTEARVAYNDTTGFAGYPLIVISERFLDSALTDINITDADVTPTAPRSNLPERIFIWQDEFWLDPIPNDTYTLRLYGYHLPNSLSADADTPDPLGIYHEAIFLKAKVLVARELGVTDKQSIIADYELVSARDRKYDKQRHRTVNIVDPKGNLYW